jgi:ribose-phosphate pyrophosphokinase
MSLKKSVIINLSTTFTKGFKPFKQFAFSGGEEHVKLFDPTNASSVELFKKAENFTILTNAQNSSSIMQTLLTTDALRRINKNAKIELFMPYFPYARQDRVMVSGEPFSLKVMTSLINSMQYDKVHVLNPHSEVTTALLDNIEQIDNSLFVEYALDHIYLKVDRKWLAIVSPDAGAEKKTYDLAKKLGITDIILGTKKRDVKDGKILKTDFVGDVSGKDCVIIDDIIDGGRTFIELAKVLRDKGANSVYLIVSHGIFSSGTEELKKHIDAIYTTNSIKYCKEYEPYVTYFELETMIE